MRFKSFIYYILQVYVHSLFNTIKLLKTKLNNEFYYLNLKPFHLGFTEFLTYLDILFMIYL